MGGLFLSHCLLMRVASGCRYLMGIVICFLYPQFTLEFDDIVLIFARFVVKY